MRAMRRQLVQKQFLGQHHGGLGILKDRDHAVPRIGRIEREIRAARLEHGHQRDYRLD